MKNDNSLAFQLWGGYFSTFPRVPGHRKTTPRIAEYDWGNTKKHGVLKTFKKEGEKQKKRKKAKGGKKQKRGKRKKENKKRRKKKEEKKRRRKAN